MIALNDTHKVRANDREQKTEKETEECMTEGAKHEIYVGLDIPWMMKELHEDRCAFEEKRKLVLRVRIFHTVIVMQKNEDQTNQNKSHHIDCK